MNITTENFDNYTEIKLDGRLDTNTAPKLEKALMALLDEGKEDLLINFTDLNYISSSGLRVLLVAAKSLDTKAKDKKLNFCSLQDFIKEVFDIAGFSVLFNFFNTPEEFKG